MKYRKYIIICAAVLLAVFAAINLASRKKNSSPPADLKRDAELKINFEAQTNNEGPVRITILPRDISKTARIWEFEVTLDSHSVELNEDLMQTYILTDNRGQEYKPLFWKGNPPGGHHREGVLAFNAI